MIWCYLLLSLALESLLLLSIIIGLFIFPKILTALEKVRSHLHVGNITLDILKFIPFLWRKSSIYSLHHNQGVITWCIFDEWWIIVILRWTSLCQTLGSRDTVASAKREERAPMPEAKDERSESFAGGQRFREVPSRYVVPSSIMEYGLDYGSQSYLVVPSTVVPSSVMEYTDTVTDMRSVAQTTLNRNLPCWTVRVDLLKHQTCHSLKQQTVVRGRSFFTREGSGVLRTWLHKVI